MSTVANTTKVNQLEGENQSRPSISKKGTVNTTLQDSNSWRGSDAFIEWCRSGKCGEDEIRFSLQNPEQFNWRLSRKFHPKDSSKTSMDSAYEQLRLELEKVNRKISDLRQRQRTRNQQQKQNNGAKKTISKQRKNWDETISGIRLLNKRYHLIGQKLMIGLATMDIIVRMRYTCLSLSDTFYGGKSTREELAPMVTFFVKTGKKLLDVGSNL